MQVVHKRWHNAAIHGDVRAVGAGEASLNEASSAAVLAAQAVEAHTEAKQAGRKA
jgi:hypothetical protein